jgi:nitrite reductase/ring-hydroxylating ferredoxin subunit
MKMSKRDLNQTIARVLSDEADVRQATAPYQSEFPYQRYEEADVTRREFCNFLGLTSAALFLGAGGFAAKAKWDSGRQTADAATRIDGGLALAPNTALNFRYPAASDSAILIKTADGQYHAYGQKCTHLACPVYYSQDHQRLECPCHEGAFEATTGKVLYGPQPRALDVIKVEVRDGEVWAVGRTPSGDERAG